MLWVCMLHWLSEMPLEFFLPKIISCTNTPCSRAVISCKYLSDNIRKMHFHSKTKSRWKCLKTQLLKSEKWVENQHLGCIKRCFSYPGEDLGPITSCKEEKQFIVIRWHTHICDKHRTTWFAQRLASRPWPHQQQTVLSQQNPASLSQRAWKDREREAGSQKFITLKYRVLSISSEEGDFFFLIIDNYCNVFCFIKNP